LTQFFIVDTGVDIGQALFMGSDPSSMTVTRTWGANSKAAKRPAGPAPMIATCICETGMVGNIYVVVCMIRGIRLFIKDSFSLFGYVLIPL
jgi:hypothetical protein